MIRGCKLTRRQMWHKHFYSMVQLFANHLILVVASLKFPLILLLVASSKTCSHPSRCAPNLSFSTQSGWSTQCSSHLASTIVVLHDAPWCEHNTYLSQCCNFWSSTQHMCMVWWIPHASKSSKRLQPLRVIVPLLATQTHAATRSNHSMQCTRNSSHFTGCGLHQT